MSDLVYKELGISKVEASNFIDDIFEFITLQLEKKNKVKIANFGSFNIRHKNERIGRNPKTKEQKVISSRIVVTFKPSKILKNKIQVQPIMLGIRTHTKFKSFLFVLALNVLNLAVDHDKRICRHEPRTARACGTT